MKSKRLVFGIIFGILCLVAVTAIALGFIHISGFIYSIDYDILDIGAYSGIEKDVAVRNYAAVMNFLSPFSTEDFSLPDLAFSETGAVHFEECRVLFRGFYIAGAASLLLLILSALFAKKHAIDRRFLLVSSVTTVALPVVILGIFAVDFDSAFVVFHKIFFNNDYWYFDYRTDPIITLLPQEFFLHCAIIIAAFWIIASLIQYILYRKYILQHTVETRTEK